MLLDKKTSRSSFRLMDFWKSDISDWFHRGITNAPTQVPIIGSGSWDKNFNFRLARTRTAKFFYVSDPWDGRSKAGTLGQRNPDNKRHVIMGAIGERGPPGLRHAGETVAQNDPCLQSLQLFLQQFTHKVRVRFPFTEFHHLPF
jgi:hypothetical protein